MSYYIEKKLNIPFEEAVERITKALSDQGFGILTEIDVKATLKRKLDVDFRRYLILGACNPLFANKAFQAEKHIGVLLPCNVVVQEMVAGKSEIAVMDPMGAMAAVENPELAQIAGDVRKKLQAALDAV